MGNFTACDIRTGFHFSSLNEKATDFPWLWQVLERRRLVRQFLDGDPAGAVHYKTGLPEKQISHGLNAPVAVEISFNEKLEDGQQAHPKDAFLSDSQSCDFHLCAPPFLI